MSLFGKDFKKLIADMCHVLPVENAGELKTNEWVNRLYLVSEGLPHSIHTSFLESLRFIKPRETELTKKNFENACMSFEDLTYKADIFKYDKGLIDRLIKDFRDTKESMLSMGEIIKRLLKRA